MNNRKLIVSETDARKLTDMLDRARRNAHVRDDYLSALSTELERAHIVPAEAVPSNVVTMHSIVQLRDLDSHELERYELVYPEEADSATHRISVLAPIGTAVLGYRTGDVIAWPVPAGVRHLRIEEVLVPEGLLPAVA